MDIDRDIDIITEQEHLLQFDEFDEDSAWELGQRLRGLAEASDVAVTIEIRLAKETVFFHAMRGTSPANADWARRKRNLVELLHASSYRIGLEFLREGGSVEERMGLSPRDHAAHGGCFPIQVQGVGVIGNVSVSGLPQREDHALVVSAIADMLGLSPEDADLDSESWQEVTAGDEDADDDEEPHDHDHDHDHDHPHGHEEESDTPRRRN